MHLTVLGVTAVMAGIAFAMPPPSRASHSTENRYYTPEHVHPETPQSAFLPTIISEINQASASVEQIAPIESTQAPLILSRDYKSCVVEENARCDTAPGGQYNNCCIDSGLVCVQMGPDYPGMPKKCMHHQNAAAHKEWMQEHEEELREQGKIA